MSQPTPLNRRRFQFSTIALLVAMALISLVLSRFYPRVYASVEVKVNGAGPMATHARIVRSHIVMSRVVDDHPQVAEMSEGDPVSWLAARVRVKALGSDTLKIRMNGFPKDRRRLRQTVDAVATAYIDFLDANHRDVSDEVLTVLRDAHDEAQTNSPLDTELLKTLAQRITAVETNFKNNPPPPRPRVIKRESGWGR